MEELNKFLEAKEILNNKLICPTNGYPIVCAIHDIFHEENSSNHNCIGCNLASSIQMLEAYFERISSYNELGEVNIDYIIKLYLFVERAYELFRIISLPKEYNKKEFSTFSLIHKWANFIKHPKAFMFCHDPVYSNDKPETPPKLLIDCEFVKKYYTGDNKNKELYERLKNATEVLVLFPNPKDLMQEFQIEVRKIESLIKDNLVYKTILNEKSTYENYFEEQDAN